MVMDDKDLHVRGLSRFVDDEPHRGLHCCLLLSPFAAGHITALDVSRAKEAADVALVLTAGDIPGRNQIGSIIEDEPLLAEDEVHYWGQPVVALYAKTEQAARKALKTIKLEYSEETPVLDPREAFKRNQLIAPARTFTLGDTDQALKSCTTVVSGKADSGAQEHFYLECQAARAYAVEGGNIRIESSTQGPTAVQKIAARVCGIPMHAVEVDVRRLGGGFGGKEDQANTWACFAALGAKITGQPTRVVLRRGEDMVATGKRHPYSSDFTMGLDKNGKILAYKAMYYQNAGAAADLSTAILERTLFHSTASYNVPNVEVTAASCRTNITPFTAFRGFGGPQGMFVFESALREASRVSGIPLVELQRINLLREGDVFPYGQKAELVQAESCWNRCFEKYGLKERMAEIDRQERGRFQRGYSLMPVCFGISFTNTSMNQARALVHVYTDGTVGVSTGAVEMGQGVNRKIRDIVSYTLGIPLDLVKIETTNTTRVANTSPTAASSGSDLNGMAAQMACQQILSGLFLFFAEQLSCKSEDCSIKEGQLTCRDKDTGISWSEMVMKAYLNRIHLSAEAHYATPELYFDTKKEKGHPFAYHSYGTAYFEVTMDRLLGTYRIDDVKIVHDSGRNINYLVDLGQVEGGLAQGIGWITMEEMRYSEKGRPLTASAGSYKVPDLYSSPSSVECEFLQNAENPKAVLNSKAVGEPPLMYGIGAFFALRMAGGIEDAPYEAPLTPERMFMALRRNR